MNRIPKKSIIISCVATVLAITVLLTVLILTRFDGAKPPENELIDMAQSTDIVNLIDYDFSSGFSKSGITKNTVLLYKTPAKLSENPEISRYSSIGVSSSLSNILESAIEASEWVEADINDYVFEGQIYHKGVF